MTAVAAAGQPVFAKALLDPTAPVPADVVAWNGSDPTARFAVYRNNVVVTLVGALADTFPVVRRLVGDEFFGAMAAAYVRQRPPRSPVLATYGGEFPDWLRGFAPARGLPYLPDVAVLERTRVDAFHAADAAPVDAAHIARALGEPDGLPASRVALHPSLAVLQLSHGAVSLWAAHQRDGDDEIAGVDVKRPECAIVLRDGDDVLVLPVDAPGAAFVAALSEGRPLADALQAAAEAMPDAAPFDPAPALATLVRHGAIVAWLAPGEIP